MPTPLHPTFYPHSRITCACGNSFLTGSTKQSMQIEVCSTCHPFFTNAARPAIAGSRSERFAARYASHPTLSLT